MKEDMNYKKRLEELFDELVPDDCATNTTAGEIARAAMMLLYRHESEGDRIGVGYGRLVCNSPARYLMGNTNEEIANLIIAMWGQTNHGAYRAIMNSLVKAVVEFLEGSPALRLVYSESLMECFDPCEDYDDTYAWYDEDDDKFYSYCTANTGGYATDDTGYDGDYKSFYADYDGEKAVAEDVGTEK